MTPGNKGKGGMMTNNKIGIRYICTGPKCDFNPTQNHLGNCPYFAYPNQCRCEEAQKDILKSLIGSQMAPGVD